MQKTAYCSRPARALIVKAMKLTVLFLTVVLVNVSAKGLSQKVSFSGSDIPLEKAFSAIELQTHYTFFYKSGLLEKARHVSVDFRDKPLTEALDILFGEQPFTYYINGKIITIDYRKAVMPVVDTSELGSKAGMRTIFGYVTDENMLPLSGVTVVAKSTQKGTQTDARGIFICKSVREDEVLVLSFIGYEKLEVPVKDRNEFMLHMKVATSELDKAVVQAYGTTSRRFATGNITKVTAEEIERQPVMNPLLALQGRVPGLLITPISNYASGTVRTEIRGRSSVNPQFTSDPLFIIDGVPLTVLELSASSSYIDGSAGFLQSGVPMPGGQNPLFSINPSDIESVEVLKDADATAIYGSRGANGVILITTKKAKAGKSKLNLNIAQGISKVSRNWKMLSTKDYLQMRRDALAFDGLTPDGFNAPDLVSWDTTRNVDWQHEIWGGVGKTTDIHAGLSGGDQRTMFRIGANYSRQTDVTKRSGSTYRTGFSFMVGHHSLDQKLNVSLNGSYTYSHVTTIYGPNASIIPPDTPPIYDENGNLNYAPWNAAGLGNNFPFGQILNRARSGTNFLTASLLVNYEVIKGLQFSTQAGYNNSNGTQDLIFPMAGANPIYQTGGSAIFGVNRNNNWIIEPQLTYNAFVGKGKLTFLAGGSLQSTTTDGRSTYGFGYTDDAFLNSIAGASFIGASQNYGEYKYIAGFGRMTYNLTNKYILNLNGRRDGSSRFGPGRQFGNFGSIAAAWIVTEEEWMKRIAPEWMSFIKLRSSYGVTGSDKVGDYQYLSQYAPGTVIGGMPLFPYNGIAPLINQHAVNQEYQWESTRKMEAAIDIGLGKENRFNLGISWYRQRCNNQLTQFPTPLFSGFANVTANWPATVQNQGWELKLDAKPVQQKDFSWDLNFNISINKNILLAYPDIERSPYLTKYKVGKALNTQYLLHSTGIDPQTGDHQYEDRNRDGRITANYSVQPGSGDDDRSREIDLSPVFFGGFGSDIRYKGFMLNAQFSYVSQKGQNSYAVANVIGTMNNQPAAIAGNYWKKPGDNAQFIRPRTIGTESDSYYNTSDGVYTDASFIRLSNLSIGYNLPASLAAKAGMESCRVFIHTNNVFVITGYKGLDPETKNFGIQPIPKIYDAGISLNF